MSLRDIWVALAESPLNFELLAHLTKKVILREQVLLDDLESARLIAPLLYGLVHFSEFA